jgi:hypothetical protein
MLPLKTVIWKCDELLLKSTSFHQELSKNGNEKLRTVIKPVYDSESQKINSI